jgi:hypothetical protein
MKFVILHLSDIHIKSDKDPILKQTENIARSIYSKINVDSSVVILVSGDIAFSGKPEQYNLAETFFREIESHIKKERQIPIQFVLCPGNHDCDFSEDVTRNFILDSIANKDIDSIDIKIFEDCTSHQNEYFKFAANFEKTSSSDRLWSTHEIEFSGQKIVFESINISWSSLLRERQGNLSFPFSLYLDKSKLDANVRISVMHHPLNWLTHSSYRDFRKTLRSFSNFIITGHEHLGNAVNHDDIESGETVIIEGGVLQEGNTLTDSSFGIITIDFADNINHYEKFEYCENEDIYSPTESKELINQTAKSINSNKFVYSKTFSSKLDDCGGYFKHSNVENLKLSDIFVYPNIRKERNQKQKIANQSSSFLKSPANFTSGVILSGDEKIGSTSLLYSLATEYLLGGFIPVLINGSDIKKDTEHNIIIQIERALLEQFDHKNIVTIFNQELTKKKILLIDDFHGIKIRAEKHRNEALKHLMSRFDKVIITVGSTFEVGELTNQDENSPFKSLDHYKIEPFGYLKRTELIRNWYSIGQSEYESDADIIAKCNIAERLMDTVMDRSLIAPLPIYLLTFLQSIQSGQSEQLTDSALGDYYNFLLKQSFLDVGVSADKLGLELDYVMHLAKYFNEKNTNVISLEEFKIFNEKYSEEWQDTGFTKKERTLVNAKVLLKNENDYEFRYQYNYYYLLGRYLSQNILDHDIQEKVRHYVKHLYVKKYANTILFLAHHTASDNILLLMTDAADSLFRESVEADFNGACTVANDLIQHAPSLEYNKRSPNENRDEISHRKDRDDEERPEVIIESEESNPSSIDLATKISMLFKTIEILSQIIKSNPSKFRRGAKVAVIKSIFCAPLRALQDFYDFLESHPNALIEAINRDLSKKSNKHTKAEKDIIAKYAVSKIIQAVSSHFIIKTAEIINSEVLQPDVPKVVKENNTLAFELIDLAMSLDNHRPIQRNKVKALFDKTENNVVARKVLDIIIMNRLHMFKPIEKDMQWLESELNYDLDRQHKIGYAKKSKRIN